MRSAALRAGVRLMVALAAVAAVGAGAMRVPELLAGIEVFRVDGLGLEGVRFIPAEDVRSAVKLPPDASVWDDPEPWLASLLEHPLVRDVRVSRRLPDSLVLHVTEVRPVALVATPTLEPVDADGRRLPIDPSRHRLDLPLLGGIEPDGDGDPGNVRLLVRELQRLETADPTFVALLSELSREPSGDLVALWGDPDVAIRFRSPLPAERLRQALSVISDASSRYPDRPLLAVDLRYAEQVVARF